MYSFTHVKRHKRLDNKTEVQTRQVFEIRTYGEKIKRQGREDNVEVRRLNGRRRDSEINETTNRVKEIDYLLAACVLVTL